MKSTPTPNNPSDVNNRINDNLFQYFYLFGITPECLEISEFTITRQWVGLLSDIRIYDQFFTNAWGIIKMGGFNTISDSPIVNLMFKSKQKNKCVSDVVQPIGAKVALLK